MSASKALRRLLRAAGVEYDTLGQYYTSVSSGYLGWVVRDNYDGTLMVCVGGRHSPEEAVEIITGRTATDRTATVTTTVDDDGVGTSTCDACGRASGEWFQYCPWCGRKFIKRRRKHV